MMHLRCRLLAEILAQLAKSLAAFAPRCRELSCGVAVMGYRFLCGALVALALACVAAHPVRADGAKGGQIAQLWCANCHVVGAAPTGVVQQGPPSFRSIARSGMSAEQLRTFLLHPHGAMPDLSLSRAEIDDLLGYIETLR